MRAMIFEDDFLLADALADALTQLGFDVATRASTYAAAWEAANHGDADLAVADLDLRGELVYPVLDRLAQRGIPFIMATGTATHDLPTRLVAAPRISKPYNKAELRQAIAAIRRAVDSADTAAPAPYTLT